MTSSPESLQQRYEAIERVYSERQWDNVARMSETLLLELPDEASHPLRQRLQLLLGHTYLYGYQDATTATGFYNRVRAATSEAVLRDIADQGLEQCAGKGQAFPITAEPAQAVIGATGSAPAMPWMNELAVAEVTPVAKPEPVQQLVVDVIDEPELIEVAQANRATAEELEIAINSESFSPEEIAELSKRLLRVVIR
ncbi:MAG: hypothetical protein WD136_04655 [Cyanobium sp.]